MKDYLHQKSESVVFKNTSSDKVFTMIGLFLFSVSIISFTIFIAAIANWLLYFDDDLLRHRNFIFIKLTGPAMILFGFWASLWLILAFSPTEMLKKNRDALIITAIFSINFFIIPQLLKVNNYENEKETFASLIITEEIYNNKNKKVWHGFLIMNGCISLIFLPFLMPLTIYLMANSRTVYLRDFDARSRVAIGFMSLFCLNPIFSIAQLYNIMHNPMYKVWQIQYNKATLPQKRTGLNRAVSVILWIFFGGMIISLYWNLIVIYSRFALLTPGFLPWTIIWIWVWMNLSTIFSIVYKKYYLENLIPVPIGNCMFDALTFNIPYFFASSIYIFKVNLYRQTPVEEFKYKINRFSVFIIMINIFLLFAFVEIIFILWILGYLENSSAMFKSWGLKITVISIFILSFCWIFLNIKKTMNYLEYAIYLKMNYIIDGIFLNVFGLIINLYASFLIRKMKKKGNLDLKLLAVNC
ncbi:hypothetical protein SSABA_v1c06420 [Spiroplasma sabaudiense Ar-1343]|uniref:Transmembrane protein n=1 Tax=Spiroplasma sabaudiense Ar-1343 TaxID=1276257 RepID=W6AJZ1_9MOLU|nr:hypothetical protein [Spiroplasma sabaudiense]AHI54044.1 hypothetical protein SSABA_v1c06420 [Spiroplasma sabaudiense Ar-1343]